MDSPLPISSLLSQALVAFIIEFDNEFERQMPHRTSNHGGAPGAPWLVSMVMWVMLLQFVHEEGMPALELESLVWMDRKQLQQWLTRLSRWWGYLAVQRGDGGVVVRPSANGLRAQRIWRPLTGTIEQRWEERFGKAEIDQLKERLSGCVSAMGPPLPACLPIPGYGLFSRLPERRGPQSGESSRLPALLSKVLLAIAIEFESQVKLSLAICANVLRICPDKGVAIREIPALSGVSKEAIAMAGKYLAKQGYASFAAQGTKSRKLVLTAKGRDARRPYRETLPAIEERLGAQRLREPLERLMSGLHRGIEPHPGCWRASLPRPETLPHFPMVLHRGGFPDGS